MAALLGLFFSALVVLKTTFAIFAALYFIGFIGGLFVIVQHKRRALLVCGMSALAALVTLLPWLALNWRNYSAAIKIAFQPSITTNAGNFSLPEGNVGALLSAYDLLYGGSLFFYGAIVLVLVLLGTFSFFSFFRIAKNDVLQRGLSLVSTAACGATIANYVLNGFLFPPDDAVRYVCPVLIAVLPFSLLIASRQGVAAASTPTLLSLTTGLKLVVLVGAGLVIFLFWDSFIVRVKRAYYQHTTVAFPINYGDILYNRNVFSSKSKKLIRDIQYLTEANKPILAWLSMPMHLDFSRNKILSVTEAALVNPWLEMPLNGDAMDMAQYLKRQGIRYVMWQYQGAGMRDENAYRERLLSPVPLYRKWAARNLYFREMMALLMGGGTILYQQDGIVLFDLNQIT